MTKIYVTKYALSCGPLVVDAEIKTSGCAYWRDNGFSNYAFGKDFHSNRADALADCERRRKAKIASLDKQRKKLESMKFEIED